jgi:hypothetical protein
MPLGFHKATLFGVAGVSTGDVVLLHDQDYSGVASASITSGIDSTYGEYIFKYYNINPATDAVDFLVQFNVAGESGFNETITSTAFMPHHYEDDSSSGLAYSTSYDQAQGTAGQIIAENIGNGSDESASGELHLFNPSSTTYVKHFYGRSVNYAASNYTGDLYTAGYVNVTGAVDEVQFSMESGGNFDGTIKMWGVK